MAEPAAKAVPCPDCENARTRLHGGYRTNCRGCWVRSMANAPAFIRAQAYRAIADDEERAEFKRAVSAEWLRLKALTEKPKEE